MARVRPNERKNNLSSLIFPIIIALVILLLLIRAIFWWSSSDTQKENWTSVNAEPNQEKSEIYIYMSWDSKKQIEWSTKFYSTDSKLEVAEWECKISFDANSSKVYINKLWEIKYAWKTDKKEMFEVTNWESWIESDGTPFSVKLKNFNIDSDWASIYSVSQNMMASSVYVLKWDIKITAESKSINIWVWQKLTLMNTDVSSADLSLDDKIEPIDDFFKEWDFFIKHNGSKLLSTKEDEQNWSWSTSWTWSTKWQKAMLITYPEDEATVDTNTINIEWKVISNKVEKVTLNDIEASLNKDEQTFVSKDFALKDSINNIVYKAYDKDDNILVKWVLTVYTSSKEKWVTDQPKPTVTTYPLSSKDFKIISPSDNPYKTTENIVKIAWAVNKWAVKFITINDFRLTKFPQYSTNWYYFANKDYGTMNDWINLYTIKYYWKDDELLYTSLFTIVKEQAESVQQNQNVEASWSTTTESSSWSDNS